MVDPMSEEDRVSLTTQLKASLVGLIAVSSGLVAHTGGAEPLESLLVIVAGAVVGGVLIRIVFPGSGESLSSRSRRRR